MPAWPTSSKKGREIASWKGLLLYEVGKMRRFGSNKERGGRFQTKEGRGGISTLHAVVSGGRCGYCF